MPLHHLKFRADSIQESIWRQPLHMPKAKNRYEEIVATGHFLCTQERPSEDKPEPIVIRASDDGCDLDSVADSDADLSGSVPAAIIGARGSDSPPTTETQFGIA